MTSLLVNDTSSSLSALFSELELVRRFKLNIVLRTLEINVLQNSDRINYDALQAKLNSRK